MAVVSNGLFPGFKLTFGMTIFGSQVRILQNHVFFSPKMQYAFNKTVINYISA